MAWIDAFIMVKETQKLERQLKKQQIPMTELQREALHERVVFLTAARISEREMEAVPS